MSYTPDAYLVFRQKSAQDGRLVFGEGDAPQSARATISLVLALPRLKLSLAVDYDNRVQRGPSLERGTVWQSAKSVEQSAALPHAQTLARASESRSSWQVAKRLSAQALMAIETLEKCAASRPGGWSRGERIDVQRAEAWRLLSKAPALRLEGWQQGLQRPGSAASIWRELDHGKRLSARSRWQPGHNATTSTASRAGVARPCSLTEGARWQNAISPKPGRRWVDPVIPPANPCYTPDPRLVFKQPAATDSRLVFVCENAVDPQSPKKIVPARRAYIVINDVSLRRADGAAVLRAPTLNLSIDADSWGWSWNATLDATQLDAVMPDAGGDRVALIARVNGTEFRLLVEKVSRSRSFEKRSLSVSGRGIAADLAAPYWPARGMSSESDRTMQQLGEDSLTINGVSSGWSLDWQAADWLVPAGAWACLGAPMDGLLRLAEAAGAYVQADPYDQTLHVLPRYKVLPWEFSSTAPDIQIPESAFVTDSVEWLDKTPFNAVYVSGDATGGVLGHVKRAGTAGDMLATMITDPLCTHADAARARALPVLADTGRQARVTGSLQVLPESGIVGVGSFIQIGGGAGALRGLVRGTKIDSTFPKLRQTLEIECHG